MKYTQQFLDYLFYFLREIISNINLCKNRFQMTPELIESLKRDILENVNDHWKKEQSPLLLSSIGAIKKGQIARELKQYGISLNEFLDSFLKDEIAVYRDEDNPIRIGAFPFSVAKQDDFSAQRYFKLQVAAAAPLNRYNHSAWAAFRVPLPPKSKRYLQISDTIRFDDVAAKDKRYVNQENFLEVKKKFIVGDKDAEPHKIANSIKDWAREHKIDETRLFIQTQRHNRKTVLNSLFAALTEDELASVSMPLSIVKKLNAKTV